MNDNPSNYRLDEIGFGSLKIYQDPSDFCYGVDAVILADFAAGSGGKRILDLGCGNGIISLILSHKTDGTIITGVEIKENAASLAALNAEINNLSHRITIINKDILDIDDPAESYDTVVTNPPYVRKGTGLVNCESKGLMIARHETSADLNDFICVSSKLLVNRGELFMVHRPYRTVEILKGLSEANLEPKMIRYVSPKQGRKPNIMLIKASKNGGSGMEVLEPLYIYDSDGYYTKEIMSIYERT